MLELRGLSILHDGVFIVRRVSLALAKGRVLGLVGPSGSGKTLLSLAVIGLLPKGIESRGVVAWKGRTVSGEREETLHALRGTEIGMVFQNTSASFDPLITIGDHVADLFSRHQNLSGKKARAAARDVFRLVEWPETIDPFDRYAHELSGGQRQRALIAMAIALKPDLVIADEPTASLDVTTAKAMLDLLKRLTTESGSALLIISHDLPALATIADEIAYLNEGVIDATYPVAAIRDRSAPADLVDLFARSLPKRKTARPHSLDPAPAITVTDLSVRHYKQRVAALRPTGSVDAVKHVSMTLQKGECLALVGESGSGKSTFARTLMGLHQPHQGHIDVVGFDPQDVRTQRGLWQKLRFVFQDPVNAVDPNWTIRHIVDEPLALLDGRLHPADRSALVAAILQKVGIPPQLFDRYPHQLSGGQLQRVSLARALVTQPEIIILDEPISALDADARGQMLDLLVTLAAETRLTILLITHDLGVARAIADRVMVMKDGEIVEAGEIMAVLDHPRAAYTKALLAASPLLAASRLFGGALADDAPQG